MSQHKSSYEVVVIVDRITLIHSLPLIVISIAQGWGLGPIPAALGRKAGYTLATSPVCCMANTDNHSHLHSHQ